MFLLIMSSEVAVIYKSNPESLLSKAGIGDSKLVVRQEALAL
jgi:hypothetical protein